MKKNTGRGFEKLILIIQEALKDSPNTKIYSNHKISDRTSNRKLREFDVFLIISANGFEIKIAIECKDYKSAVALEKIEAFNTKCNSVIGINKKIMISAKGFQTGVVENAKELYDIDLFLLNTVRKTP